MDLAFLEMRVTMGTVIFSQVLYFRKMVLSVDFTGFMRLETK